MDDYLVHVRKRSIGLSFVDAETGKEYLIEEIGESACGMVQLIVKNAAEEKLRNYWICETTLATIAGIEIC